MQNKRYVGSNYEDLAANFLLDKGYNILKMNFRCKGAEVDIIARDKNTLVFVEVKKRRTLDEAAYAITLKQMQRLIKGAAVFVGNKPQYSGYDIRFDAVLVNLPFSIRHLQNAWIA